MKDLSLKFKTLRINLRLHGKNIAEDVVKRFHPINIHPKGEICVFCNSIVGITKEHVLPKWILNDELHSTMVSSVNRQTLTYNKAIVPACSECNNSILGYIEKNIIKVIEQVDKNKDCSIEDMCNLVRWMEIIEYKFQVLDCRRKYIKYDNSEYDRTYGVIPVSMMRHFSTMSPWKAYDWLRSSQRRITVKGKAKNINSLVIIRTQIRHFYFFVQPSKYIYLSFPMYNVAFFYFVKERFEDYADAGAKALSIIENVINSE